MELLKNLERRLESTGKLESWGIFKCPFCLQEVERRLSNGKLAKSCGCKRNELISKGKKDKKDSVEIKQKKSNSHKGMKFTKEHKQNISKGNKGKKRKPLTEEHKQRIGEGNKGKKQSEETIEKRTEKLKGKKRTEVQKQKIREAKLGTCSGENNPFYGKKHTGETRKKQSESRIGKCVGEDNPNWNNGSSFEPYSPEFNKELKKSILKRDNYTCQCLDCIALKETDLHIHHIDYDKQNNTTENLITLCNSCHSKTNNIKNRDSWIAYYKNIMENKINV